jgi:hypothetical protein
MIYSWLFAESDHCQSGIMTHRCHKLLTFWYQKLLGDFHIGIVTVRIGWIN